MLATIRGTNATHLQRENAMPIYEFHCADCDKKFELFTPTRMSTDGVVCRTCHGANVRRLVSTFASVGGGAEESSFASESSTASSGGGCCGGSCGCSH